jgi:putative heme iron utilization protein
MEEALVMPNGEGRAGEPAAHRDPAAAAGELLRRERVGVLSTLSVRLGGAPLGAVAPYGLSPRGAPTLLLSPLAQHTRNVSADPRASLLVSDSAALARDPRRAARVVVVGRVVPVEPVDLAAVREGFLAVHPEARELLGLDFRFYQLDPVEVMYVGGLAQASFLPASVLGEIT